MMNDNTKKQVQALLTELTEKYKTFPPDWTRPEGSSFRFRNVFFIGKPSEVTIHLFSDADSCLQLDGNTLALASGQSMILPLAPGEHVLEGCGRFLLAAEGALSRLLDTNELNWKRS